MNSPIVHEPRHELRAKRQELHGKRRQQGHFAGWFANPRGAPTITRMEAQGSGVIGANHEPVITFSAVSGAASLRRLE